jgi:hypothetical protein
MRSNVLELLDKINRLAKQPGFPAVSKLEKDLLKQYLREIYAALEEELAVASPVAQEEPKQEPVVIAVKESVQPEELIGAITPPVVKAEVKPVADAVNEVKEESNPVLASVKNSINEIIKPAATLNERVKGTGKEIHRQFSAKHLKDMIDLNRKFVFVNELFKGDSDSFAKAIQQLDTLEDYDAAIGYAEKTLAPRFAWDMKAQPVKLFYKLLKQKFGEE